MKKWMIIAGTAFVWSAGFAATAALSYVTREPAPTPVVVAKLPTPPPARLALAKTMPTATEHVIVLPTVEIVGSLPPKPKVAAVAPAATHEIHCSPYRPLEQGSSSVQICE